MCLKTFSCRIGHATIESTEHLISNHILPMTSQVLELGGKSFYISICITATWNSHSMLLRINTFFLANTIDTCLTKLEGEIQTKNRSSIISKFVSWLVFVVCVFLLLLMFCGFFCFVFFSDGKCLLLFVYCMSLFNRFTPINAIL